MFRKKVFMQQHAHMTGVVWAMLAVVAPIIAYLYWWPWWIVALVGWSGVFLAFARKAISTSIEVKNSIIRWFARRQTIVPVELDRQSVSKVLVYDHGDVVIRAEVADWLKNNTKASYGLVPPVRTFGPQELWFRAEKDAILFKMKWL